MNPRRGRPLLLLAAAVGAAHLALLAQLWPPRLGAGSADGPQRRIEVSFVRVLTLAPPPVPRPPPPSPPRPRLGRLSPAWAEASATATTASAAPLPRALALADADADADATVGANAADAVAAALVEAPALPVPPQPSEAALTALAASAWPPSTRLSYRLTGHVRGPVHGQARVEWLRSGTRYQVFMEASVGPAVLPFMRRRESSEGEITLAGLSPRRYEMEMQWLLRETRRSTILMDADRVHLPGGREGPRARGLQDAVSQFVQMTWLFSTQPQRLTPGGSVEWPLALSRRVLPWTYDIGDTETLATPAGPVPAVHLKPRRPAPPGDYTAEVWIAPGLRHLPVRIVVRQDARTYIDLQLERLPEQAEPTDEADPQR